MNEHCDNGSNMYSIKSPNASKHMMTPFTDSITYKTCPVAHKILSI